MPQETNSLNYSKVLELQNDLSQDADHEFFPDRRDGKIYVYKPELKLAVEIALVTGRPLLLRGEPGSGKSSFAPFVARNLNWRYYEFVVTARTQARDFLWTFDTLQRLNDAQAGQGKQLNDFDYVKPGALWWVFNRELAFARGDMSKFDAPSDVQNNRAKEPFSGLNTGRKDGAVLLIDEIDKADPDIPNNLLVPLGSQSFVVEETGTIVERAKETLYSERDEQRKRKSPLVVITTNEERALPQAFLRRCVVYQLPPPEKKDLERIARCHFAQDGAQPDPKDEELFSTIAQRIIELRESIKNPAVRKPSVAEYLDAVRACKELDIAPDSETWSIVKNMVVCKERQ